ncbi:hypothetical protein CKN82_05870 [Carnobacterium divergens]|uniref:hypothetical protein n=1 Tax=Carnobacterium divergens TaxID=2748 RepID=UPI000E7396E8|nr:hypothetical protein [Carnobacterium divergens]AOA00666.1 hypothetical protein BFC22_11465 [Carnobacterium divergens]MDT1996656.1 hypothetical protein [Carnobacterium divergens]TFI60646.1 hypothetical protein CKN76_13205 [Carnobacterium divergens]TFI61406.1 hypothetical protein CKN59_12940 [Carnobacterium divergens]TFI69556.1 hypothetical protein CKN70_05920 [Carnobacterium divergens]
MINQEYLKKFGEKRYFQQLSASEVSEEALFGTPIDIIEMKFLKELGSLNSWSSILYDLYYYSEMIQRIDFFSKYYFHSFSPKARNIASVKVVFIHGEHLFLYHPLTDRVYIYQQNYFVGLDAERDYILVINDNRKLQKFYGDFASMLSMLNTGHSLYNLDYVLERYKIRSENIASHVFFKQPNLYVTIPVALKIAENQEYHLSQEDIKEEEQTKYFKLRTSEQNIRGDAVIGKVLSDQIHQEIFNAFQLAATEYPEIKLWCFVDHIADVRSGFYRGGVHSDFLCPKTKQVYKQLLQEYQDFTNLEGMNYWLFFTFEKNETNYDEIFIRIGHFAQRISVIAAQYGLAARGMKNYNDDTVKEKFSIGSNELVGYSVNLFSYQNTGHSLMLE